MFVSVDVNIDLYSVSFVLLLTVISVYGSHSFL